MPSPTRPFTADSFYKFLAEQHLMASRCTACGALHLPPRAICPRCHGEALEWVETSGRGRLAAFTAISVAPSALVAEGFGRDNPYCSAIVELEEGVLISARLLDVDARHPGTIRIGTPLTVVFVEHGSAEHKEPGLAFRPAAG
jgi:uncharacterized OB-fold protein